MTALYLNRVLKSSATFNSLAKQEETEPTMKSALLIQAIILPAILANLLTIDLVMPNYDHMYNVTVTGKKQSSDETPVKMSQIPDDKAVCKGDDNEWTWYCADRTTINYIDRISFAEKTKDPRLMIIEGNDGTATVSHIMKTGGAER
jgi:hypothetical protein